MNKIEKVVGYFKSYDSHQIYFEKRGSGEPIIFIYGIACLMNHWHHQVNYFSDKYSTLLYDLRGHHRTLRPSQDSSLTIEALAKDALALLEHLNLKSAHFMGHSFGSQVMIKAYELNPSAFKSLVFVNGFASNPIKNMFGLNIVETIYHQVNNNYVANPQLWTTLWKLGVENPLSVYLSALAGGFNIEVTSLKDIEVYAKGVANIDLGVFLKFFGELMSFNGDESLKNIKAPTLVVGGEKDRVTPLDYQQKMHDLISGSELLVVPYGSHCTQLDFPEFLNLRIEKFFRDHSS